MRWAFLRLPCQRREPDNFLLPPASSPILLCLKGRAFASTLIATPATGFALLRLVVTKLIVHAPTRAAAGMKMRQALAVTRVAGSFTNLPFLRELSADGAFVRGQSDILPQPRSNGGGRHEQGAFQRSSHDCSPDGALIALLSTA